MSLPTPPFHLPLVDKDGFVSTGWQPFLQAVVDQGATVTAALSTAKAAAPGSAEVVTLNGLHGGGRIGGNAAVRLYRAVCAVADLPTMASEGDLAYAIDGRRGAEGSGAGTGVPVWYSAGTWYAIDSGAAVAA